MEVPHGWTYARDLAPTRADISETVRPLYFLSHLPRILSHSCLHHSFYTTASSLVNDINNAIHLEYDQSRAT